MDEVPWLTLARDLIGVKEISGDKHEPKILALWRDSHLRFTTDEDPWCAAFVGACLERAVVNSTRKPNARSYEHWGDDVKKNGIKQIPLGAIVVYERPPDTWTGHVGFAVGRTEDNEILTLGGNQRDSVSIAPFEQGRLIAARWPSEFAGDLRLLHHIPLMQSTGALSTNEA
jgi:uncharacterized protein (TIGR02594 family)